MKIFSPQRYCCSMVKPRDSLLHVCLPLWKRLTETCHLAWVILGNERHCFITAAHLQVCKVCFSITYIHALLFLPP